MSKPNRQLTALLYLLDDPDSEVSELVESQLVSYGGKVIPQLEEFWESAEDGLVQNRVEEIIHKIQWAALEKDFGNWKSNDASLLEGVYLLCRYFFPELQQKDFITRLEPIRKSLWLELNPYLTTLEQARVFEKIIFGYYGFKIERSHKNKPLQYLLTPLLETQKGNRFAMQMLYLIMGEQLDLPVRAVHVEKQVLIAWFNPHYLYGNTHSTAENNLLFFSDAHTGIGYPLSEVYDYLRRNNKIVRDEFFLPVTNQQLVAEWTRTLAACFPETEIYRRTELLHLTKLLGNH